jgi:fatty acid desaturase
MRSVFWVAALGFIATYVFFFALGAFAVDEVVPLSIAVGVLALLWVGHAVLQARHPAARDPRLVQGRERRGF